jgi:hypothetical protein
MFKAVIDQSTSLQQSLFLKARTSNLPWVIACRSASNAFKTDQLLAGLDMAHHIMTAISKGKLTFELSIFELHPTLCLDRHCGNCGTVWYMRQSVAEGPNFATGYPTVVLFDHRIKTLLYPPAHSSMDKTFLSQPPVRDVKLALKCRCRDSMTYLTPPCQETHFTERDLIAVHNDTGITFGQVRDSIKHALCQYPAATLDYIMFDGGLPVTMKEKQSVEAAGVLTWENDSSRRVKLKDVGEHLWRWW